MLTQIKLPYCLQWKRESNSNAWEKERGSHSVESRARSLAILLVRERRKMWWIYHRNWPGNSSRGSDSLLFNSRSRLKNRVALKRSKFCYFQEQHFEQARATTTCFSFSSHLISSFSSSLTCSLLFRSDQIKSEKEKERAHLLAARRNSWEISAFVACAFYTSHVRRASIFVANNFFTANKIIRAHHLSYQALMMWERDASQVCSVRLKRLL